MTELFYRAIVWLHHFELAIARSTGRNPAHIRKLCSDLDYWRYEHQKWMLNHSWGSK